MTANLFELVKSPNGWLKIGEGLLSTIHSSETFWDIYFSSNKIGNKIYINKLIVNSFKLMATLWSGG
jgi:hypothetical protein